MAFDLDTYAAEAEQFETAIGREYYMHFAGIKEEFEIAPIYERHAGLFRQEIVEQLREELAAAKAGDSERRHRYFRAYPRRPAPALRYAWRRYAPASARARRQARTARSAAGPAPPQ